MPYGTWLNLKKKPPSHKGFFTYFINALQAKPLADQINTSHRGDFVQIGRISIAQNLFVAV